MTKAYRIRKRYIFFSFDSDYPFSSHKDFIFHLQKEFLKFFGEYGFSEIYLRLEHFDPENKRAILSCERGKQELVEGFLILTRSLSGKRVRFKIIRKSGILSHLLSEDNLNNISVL